MPCLRLTPSRRALALGEWRVELVGDELVDVRFGPHPVLRGVRAVVRDADWRTLTADVTSAEERSTRDELVSRLGIRYSGWGQHYAGTVTVTLRADRLRVDFQGRADAAFRGNRIGLVALHHPHDAGAEVTVTTPAGERTLARFPVEISPHQPLVNIADMQWHRDGINIRLRFAGDVFETEDQRNWTDASFKTYGTPLSRPFPVQHAAGSVVQQSITVSVRPDGAAGEAHGTQPGARVGRSAEPMRVIVTADVAGRVPPIGVAYAAADTVAAVAPAVPPLRGIESLLVELDGALEGRRSRFADAAALAERLDAPIDLRIVAAGPAELAATLDAIDLGRVCRLAAYDPISHVTEPPLWSALTAESTRHGFTGELAAGSRAHFTELNRTIARLPPDAAGVTFSLTPQMHAREVERIVQTLPMQTLVLRSALRLAPGRAVHVGPITLRPRFNAVATTAGGSSLGAEDAGDELQSHPFTAAWTLGSVRALSGVGAAAGASSAADSPDASGGPEAPDASGAPVASVSYFETTGPAGVDAVDGTPYPVGRLIRALAPLAGADVLRVAPHDERLVVYPVRTAHSIIVFVGNLNESRRHLEVAVPAELDAAWVRSCPAVEHFAGPHAATLPLGGDPEVVWTADGRIRVSVDPWAALALTLTTIPPATAAADAAAADVADADRIGDAADAGPTRAGSATPAIPSGTSPGEERRSD